MIVRQNEKNSNYIRFNEKEIFLAEKMLKEMSVTLDVMRYLMRRGDERAYVLTFVETDCSDAEETIKRNKRETDLCYRIDRESGIYVIVCQDTRVDGGYHFATRILELLERAGGKRTYIVEMEVGSTEYTKEDILFRVLEMYIRAKKEGEVGKISYKSLH